MRWGNPIVAGQVRLPHEVGWPWRVSTKNGIDSAVISGVPIVEPLFEVLSASLVVVDGGVATEVLSFGDVKVVWK